MAILELVVIAAAIVLIYVIWSLWSHQRRTGDGELDASAPASELYNDMATNWSPFNLMVDFKEPIKTEGPPGTTYSTMETFKF